MIRIEVSHGPFGRTWLIYRHDALLGALDDAPRSHQGEVRVYLNTYGGGLTLEDWDELVEAVRRTRASIQR